jgi:hypothetical protein
MSIAKKIVWRNHPDFTNEIQGLIGEQEIFTIKSINKNLDQWNLFSWAFRNETFNNSASSRNLGTFLNSELAKDYAEQKWNQFVNELISIDSNVGF